MRETSQRKKILIVTTIKGFLMQFEQENVRTLKELGYEVHYASNGNEKGYLFDDSEMDELGVIFHHIDIAKSPFKLGMNRKALKQLRKIIKEEEICLIHCHTPVGGMLGRLAGMSSRSKDRPLIIYTAHGFHFYKGSKLFYNTVLYLVERIMARHTDALVTINREDYEASKKMRLKKDGVRMRIPGVGVDLNLFVPASDNEKTALRKKHDIPEGAFYVLAVGEMNQNKNHIALLKSAKLNKEFSDRGRQIVYGICGDGYCREEIIRESKEMGLDGIVIFHGYQRNIREYYAMSDITVFPSIREGLGMVGLESMAMGVPVLASDNRGTREYMHDGENGYVFRHDDYIGFAESILKMSNMSREQMELFSRRCRKTVLRFDRKYSKGLMRRLYMRMDAEGKR